MPLPSFNIVIVPSSADIELDLRNGKSIVFPSGDCSVLPDLMIPAINGALIEDLVEAGNELDLL
jgi:hypothetical protein